MKKEKTIKENLVFDGKIIKVYDNEVLCPSGNVSSREIITHNGGVCILGFIDNKVILERQYRYAYDEEIIELPAGKLEKGENPIEAAKREFQEETGYKVVELEEYGHMYPTCGYSAEVIHLFYASKIEKSERNLDEDEYIDIELIELDKVIEMINSNIIKDAKTIALISKYVMKKK